METDNMDVPDIDELLTQLREVVPVKGTGSFGNNEYAASDAVVEAFVDGDSVVVASVKRALVTYNLVDPLKQVLSSTTSASEALRKELVDELQVLITAQDGVVKQLLELSSTQEENISLYSASCKAYDDLNKKLQELKKNRQNYGRATDYDKRVLESMEVARELQFGMINVKADIMQTKAKIQSLSTEKAGLEVLYNLLLDRYELVSVSNNYLHTHQRLNDRGSVCDRLAKKCSEVYKKMTTVNKETKKENTATLKEILAKQDKVVDFTGVGLEQELETYQKQKDTLNADFELYINSFKATDVF